MTMQDAVPLTQGAYDELQAELERLRTEGRREVAEEIADTLESEPGRDEDMVGPLNAVREEQGRVEGRIMELESILARAEIIDEAAVRGSETVQVGSTVVVEDERGNSRTYQILGSPESDPGEGKISLDSPIGAALLGKRAGATVKVEAPAGVQRLTIKELR